MTLGGAAGSSTTATMQVQLKPSLLVQADATASASGQTFPVHIAVPSAAQAVILSKGDLGGM